MAETQQPFADVRILPDGFSIPALKWRELLFVGAHVHVDELAVERAQDEPS